MVKRLTLALLVFLLLLSLFTFKGGSQGGGDPLGILGLYAEYECPPLIWNLNYAKESVLDHSGIPNVLFLAKYSKTSLYKDLEGMVESLAKKYRVYTKDPLELGFLLDIYYESLYKNNYRFHYNLSFHVIGYSDGFYDIVLRLKISIVSLKNLSYKLYESQIIEERVRVSARDRSVIYRDKYAGIWPFFLLPHEIYEGSKVKLSDMILFKLFNRSIPIEQYVEGELKPEIGEGYWESLTNYFKEVAGITIRPENTLKTSVSKAISDGSMIDYLLWASFNVSKDFYESLGFRFTQPFTGLGRVNQIVLHPRFYYEVSSGLAYKFNYFFIDLAAPDILTYVIPLVALDSYYFGGASCSYWILTSTKKLEPSPTTQETRETSTIVGGGGTPTTTPSTTTGVPETISPTTTSPTITRAPIAGSPLESSSVTASGLTLFEKAVIMLLLPAIAVIAVFSYRFLRAGS